MVYLRITFPNGQDNFISVAVLHLVKAIFFREGKQKINFEEIYFILFFFKWRNFNTLNWTDHVLCWKALFQKFFKPKQQNPEEGDPLNIHVIVLFVERALDLLTTQLYGKELSYVVDN